MSAHTVSDGGGHSSPSRVADNPKKPPDKGAAQSVAPGGGNAQKVHTTPGGRVKAFFMSGARRSVAALASPTRRSRTRTEDGVDEEARVAPSSEDSVHPGTPSTKRRKKDKDDVWSSAPMVPEAIMTDESHEHDAESEDGEDVFSARPTIAPMTMPQPPTQRTALASPTGELEPMEEDEDDDPESTAANELAKDIADLRERINPRTLAAFWVRKEIVNLLAHCGDVRARTLTGASLQFDFDAPTTAPQVAPVAPGSRPADEHTSTSERLLRLEEGIAKIQSLIEGRVTQQSPTQPVAGASPTSPASHPSDPSSYAAKAAQQPTSQTPTAQKPAATPAAPSPDQRGRRYDEARAIFQLATPLSRTDRLERSKTIAADTEAVNLALIEECGSTDGPRVAGLSWSENGNLVLMAMDGYTGAQLTLHADTIAKAAGITCAFSARQDTPWHKATLTRVPTVGPDGQLLSDADVQANLARGNPRFAALSLVDCLSPVHWLTSELARRSQPSASMVVCFAKKEDADTFLTLNNRLYVFGHSCGTRKFDERNADPMCTNCWTIKPKHRTSGCRGEPRCRICAGRHHSDEHQCDKCAAELAESNGDAAMANNDTPRARGPCEHIPLKCVNCGEAHAANDARCAHRRKIVGSNASAPPMSGVAAQKKNARRRGKRSPATGANATKPIEQENPEGETRHDEGWPETLDYGSAEQDAEKAPTAAAATPPDGEAVTAQEREATQEATQRTQDAEPGDAAPVLVIDNAPKPLTGQAKRAARIKALKEAFHNAPDEEHKRWVSRANGDVEIAIELGLAHYQGKSGPGDRKLNNLRTRWAVLNAPPKPQPVADPTTLDTPPAAPASKTAISFLVTPHESA
ncbi:hypothetical protein EXIGLDRAFT_779485 [Exidia glandulosa HHB12029]|uniref:Uncharacterized protein n=1 Tax=Exidia glandulosa HHB12029 TaxID=1314781 RepID=A0A165C1T1_EXIGL|nr:hypothetical protein EXIGLDRAFT_779485 [Exidia glandulosa HHB12029]